MFVKLNGAYNTTGIKNMCIDSKIDFLSQLLRNERGIYNLAHIAQAVILFLLTTVFLKGAKVALG